MERSDIASDFRWRLPVALSDDRLNWFNNQRSPSNISQHLNSVAHCAKTIMRPFLIYLSLCIFVFTVRQAAHAQSDPYAQALREAGISPTKESLREHLLSLVPSAENRQRAETLVKQLGQLDFQTREAAQATLTNMSNPPLGELRQAAESDDPEMRFRAKQILAEIDAGAARSGHHAVFGYIVHHQLKGLTFPVLQCMPYSGDNSPYGLAARALKATSSKEDAEMLRKAITIKPSFRRAAAIAALADVLGDEAAGDLRGLLDSDDALVRLAAAEALANLGDRSALPTLVKLLDAEELAVRSRGAEVLRNFTGQQFHFIAYGQLEDRTAAAGRWRTWVVENGKTAELRFPLAKFSVFLGRTLMSQYPSTLREIDADGNKLLEIGGFQYVWGCHGTADGHRLVVDFAKRVVLEYDDSGKEILRLDKLPGPPSDGRRLDNGNLLLALAEADKVVEMDRQGKVVWSVALKGRPTTANRLANGNTVVNLQFGKKVVEVDPAGKVVWQLDGLSDALTAQALSNGNVLVCEMNQGKAIEYNREGKIVWEQGGFANACQAQRLPDGNTLVSDENGLHEYSPDGEKVWSLRVPRGRFWRY